MCSIAYDMMLSLPQIHYCLCGREVWSEWQRVRQKKYDISHFIISMDWSACACDAGIERKYSMWSLTIPEKSGYFISQENQPHTPLPPPPSSSSTIYMVRKTTRQTNTRLVINVNICFITTLRLTLTQYIILVRCTYKSICFCVFTQNDANKSGKKAKSCFKHFQ